MSLKNQNIGLKCLQYFQSYAEDTKSMYIEEAMDFFDKISNTLVNGEVPFKYKKKSIDTEVSKFEEFSEQMFQDKQHKSNYLNFQIKFVDKLKYLSLTLKTKPLIERSAYLKAKLAEINLWMQESLRVQAATIETD